MRRCFLLIVAVLSISLGRGESAYIKGAPELATNTILASGGTLKSYVDTIGAKVVTLVISTPISYGSAVTVPTNITLERTGNGSIDCENVAGAVTINGPIISAPQLFFVNCPSGSVTIGPGAAPFILVEWFGADPRGVSDSTATIQAALDAPGWVGNNLATSGATIVRLGNGVYLFNATLSVPGTVDVQGGGRGSILKATASGAMLNYPGNGETKGGGIHGVNGNFTINGNLVSTTAMRIGITTGTFFDIYISEALSEGLRLDGTQNSTFLNLFINHTGDASGTGSSLILDGASAGISFIKGELNNAGRSHIVQTKTLDGGQATIAPFNNAFHDFILERYKSNANATAAIEIGAGSFNFYNSQILSPLASGKSSVKARSITYNATVYDPAGYSFTDCNFQGNGSGTGQIIFDSDVTTFSNFVIQGRSLFSGNTTVFSLDDQTNVNISGIVTAASITNWFTNNGGGVSVAASRIVQTVDARALLNWSIPTSYTSNVMQGFEGATKRFEITGNGRANVFRYKATLGTTLVTGDYALSAGWGNTASVGTLSGNDQRAQFTVTSAGTGQGANPTITLTFKDGTWSTAPIFTVLRNGGTGIGVTGFTWTTSATALTITAVGTPIAGETYTIVILGLG